MPCQARTLFAPYQLHPSSQNNLAVVSPHACPAHPRLLSPCAAGTTKDRARVTLAGAIIATIALFALVLALGVFDEETGKANRRGGTGEPGQRRDCSFTNGP